MPVKGGVKRSFALIDNVDNFSLLSDFPNVITPDLECLEALILMLVVWLVIQIYLLMCKFKKKSGGGGEKGEGNGKKTEEREDGERNLHGKGYSEVVKNIFQGKVKL